MYMYCTCVQCCLYNMCIYIHLSNCPFILSSFITINDFFSFPPPPPPFPLHSSPVCPLLFILCLLLLLPHLSTSSSSSSSFFTILHLLPFSVAFQSGLTPKCVHPETSVCQSLRPSTPTSHSTRMTFSESCSPNSLPK